MSDELMHEPDAAQVILPPGFLKNPVHLLAFGFGSGAAPRAPGTWGSFAAIPLWSWSELPTLPHTDYSRGAAPGAHPVLNPSSKATRDRRAGAGEGKVQGLPEGRNFVPSGFSAFTKFPI